MVKGKGRKEPRCRKTKRTPQVGQAVRAVTQYDGTILAEITQIDGHIYTVKGQNGKTYRLLSSEIL